MVEEAKGGGGEGGGEREREGGGGGGHYACSVCIPDSPLVHFPEPTFQPNTAWLQ